MISLHVVAHLLGMVPPSVMESHHMLKPTLTMVLDRKTVNTTRELISRLRKALKMELQAGRTETDEDFFLKKKVCNLCLMFEYIPVFFLGHVVPIKLKHSQAYYTA